MPKDILRKIPRRLVVLASLALSACTPVGAFNIVAGRDGDSMLLASDVAFGEHPRHRLDVYGPVPKAANVPVIMFFYGGSWNSGRRQDYAFVGRALASRGYVVVIADYRLVPDVVFPSFLEDNARAVRWAQENIGAYGGNGAQIALMGHSAGAYNAAMLALDTRYLSRAGVRPANVKALIGLAGPYDFLPFTSPAAAAALSAWPKPAETQPITYAREGAPAAFLATGDRDDTVKPSNTRTLSGLLRQRRVSVTEKHYPEADHAGILVAMSRLLRNRAPVLEDVTAFLEKRLPLQQQ